MIDVTHHFTEIAGHRIFYREAGHDDAATVLVLYGAPASSFMFRHLIPLLADLTAALLDQLGCDRYAMYVL